MSNNKRLILAMILSIIVSIIAIVLFQFQADKTKHTLAVVLGGNFIEGGYIQFLTYIAFFWAMFEILAKGKIIKVESGILMEGLLPEKDMIVIYREEINEIKKRMYDVEQEKKHNFFLTTLIKQASTKYVMSGSVSEVIDLVSQQSSLNQEKDESSHSIIKYLLWSVPSIGFVGTVIGIAQALENADIIFEKGKAGVKEVAGILGVAFDTTLVALLLSIVAMYFFHRLQEKTENLHSNIEQYVIDNFINRIGKES